MVKSQCLAPEIRWPQAYHIGLVEEFVLKVYKVA